MIPGITAGQVMPHYWSAASEFDGETDIDSHMGQPLLASAIFVGGGDASFEIMDQSARAFFVGAGSMLAQVNYRNMRATLAGSGNALAWRGNLNLQSTIPFIGSGGFGPVTSSSAFAKTLLASGTIPANSSFRQVIDPLSRGGNYVRVSFKAGVSTFGMTNCSIGIQSTTYNTTSTPVELLFNGVSGFSIAAGQTVVSEWTPLVFLSSDTLVVIGDAGARGGAEAYTTTDVVGCVYYSKTSTNSYNVASPTGSWTPQNNTDIIPLVEAGESIGSPISIIQTSSIALSGTGTMPVNATMPGTLYSAAATFAAAGTMSVNATMPTLHVAVATFAGSGAMPVNATMRSVYSAVATFAGAGSLSVNATVESPIKVGTAALAGAANLSFNFAAEFLSRASSLDSTHINAYTDLINGLWYDGVWEKLEALWVLTTQNKTTALLNLRSTSFALTETGTPTFTADSGYTTIGANYLTGPTLASLSIFTQNNGHISIWDLTTGGGTGRLIGNGTTTTHIHPRFSDNKAYFRVNDATGTNATVPTTKGFSLANRTSSSSVSGYKNGVLVAGPTSSTSGAKAGTLTMSETGVSTDIIAAASVGGTLTATDVANFNNRLVTYLRAVGVSSPGSGVIYTTQRTFAGAGNLSCSATVV